MKRDYRLFTPGPTEVPEFIRQATAKPLVYHRTAEFTKIFASLRTALKKLLQTESEVFVFAASGTGAMEACVANLVSYHDRLLVVSCGKFGERWREIGLRYGGYVNHLTAPYGKSVPPEELERTLKTDDAIKFVFTTLTETSTGALNDIKNFGEICRNTNRILVVDGIAGIGADRFLMDGWKVDVLIGASQKALFTPPGLSFLAINDRAWKIVEKSRSPRYYFDLKIYREFLNKGEAPFTPPITIIYGLDKAVRKILKIGLKKTWQNHYSVAEFLRKKVKNGGLELFPETPSNALTVIKLKEGINGTKIIDVLKKKHRILLADGQKELKGKIIRIGHMGYITKTEINRAWNTFLRVYKKFS